MRKFIVANLIAIAVLGCEQNNSTNKTDEIKAIDTQIPDWKSLKEADYQIQYPPNWQLDQSKNAGTAFILFGRKEGEFRENVNLLVQDLRGLNFDLDKYVEVSEQQFGTMLLNSKLIESERIKTENGEHHKIVVEGE